MEGAAPKPQSDKPNGVHAHAEEACTEEAPELTYADIIEGYAELSGNQKKKIRKKNKLQLREAQDKATAVWEAKQKKVVEPEIEDVTSPDHPLSTDSEAARKRGPQVDEGIRLKICDLGNGCWTHHHFSSEIQTRQYRSPETIIGVNYGTSADVWSFACMIFEMITGDFLFDPRKSNSFDKDDDHLAQMMEILGKMPKNFALSGKHSKRYFDVSGHL